MQPRELETVTARGGAWLLFRVVSRLSRSSESLRNCKTWRHCDLALDAVIEYSVSLIRSSQIVPPLSLSHIPPHFTQKQRRIPRSEFSAQTAGPSTITSWDFSFRCRSLALTDEPGHIATDAIMQELMAKSGLHLPAPQELIVIEENRAYRVFSEWQTRIKSKSAWQTPLGLCVALALTMATSTFTDLSWISKGTLKGFFLFCLLGSFSWLVYEVTRALRGPSASVDDFIVELKKGTTRTEVGAGSLLRRE
jgi:hypothetical protein